MAASGLLCLGCAGEQTLAAGLVSAARPTRLPAVVSCWEKELEAAGFQGEYTATVDVTIDGSSRLHDAHVRALDRSGGGVARDPAPFRACLEAALSASALPTAADKDGPGFHVALGVEVKGLSMSFVDASPRPRATSDQQANVLVGPRADRCLGLYSHGPPRDASTLYDEIARTEARVRSLDRDADQRARELQKQYDAELELGERLAADLKQPDLPEANRARIRKAAAEVAASAHKIGARIGCAR